MASSSTPAMEESTRALFDSVSKLNALQDPESDDEEFDDEPIDYDDDDSLSDGFGDEPNQAAVEEAREKTTGRGLVIPQNYKTQLCRNWEKDKECPYGKRCVFAHDLCELRTIQINLVAMAHVAWMRQGKDVYGRPAGLMPGPPDQLYSLNAHDPSANAPFWYPHPYSEFLPGPPGFQPGFPPPGGEMVPYMEGERKKKKKDKKEKKHKKHKKHKKEKKDKEGEGREKGDDGEKKKKKHKKHKKHKKEKKDKRKEEGDSSGSDTDVPAASSSRVNNTSIAGATTSNGTAAASKLATTEAGAQRGDASPTNTENKAE